MVAALSVTVALAVVGCGKKAEESTETTTTTTTTTTTSDSGMMADTTMHADSTK